MASESTKMGNNLSRDNWSRTYENIKNTHDASYVLIEEAISLEEAEKPIEAIVKYKEGILQIDRALNIPVTYPENPDSTWEKAKNMIQKMKKTRAEVLTRINSIQPSSDFTPPVPPPSYDEAIASSPSTSSESGPRTYTELAEALNSLAVDPSVGVEYTILYTHSGVRLYMISPDGQVSSTSEPQNLTIAITDDNIAGVERRGFLQVGNWVYPLVPGVSPCYRTDFGAFVFPDVHSDVSGSCIGLLLPEAADSEVYDLLESILNGIVGKGAVLDRRSIRERREEPSDKISRGLINGATTISRGLVTGASKIADLINYGTPRLMSNIRPATQTTRVNPVVAKSLRVTQNVTSGAAQVTGIVAGAVGSATLKLGRYLAPHIQRQGTNLLTHTLHYSQEEASSRVNQILNVAASAVESFSTVYSGLETSAGILGRNLKDNTVKIVNHKYGRQVGDAADDTLQAVGNVIVVNSHLKIITPKGLVKQTAKDAGRAVAQTRSTYPEESFEVVSMPNLPHTSPDIAKLK